MVKIEIYNGSERQFIVDTKGQNAHKDIFLIGINEKIVLDVDESQIIKISQELPKGAQMNVLG